MQYNYFLFGWEVMLLHTSSLVARYARHSRLGVQKYYFSPKKKVILYFLFYWNFDEKNLICSIFFKSETSE